MEVEGGSCVVCSNILRLPQECVSHALSLTTPRDACRSEAISALFRLAAVSDEVWKRFIPSDYGEILALAVDRVEYSSMKHLYFRLCDPILIDSGKMGFFVDRDTGAKCFILSARELGIAWGDSPQYWRWIHHPESRFAEVAELMNVCWLDIRGRINSKMLSKRSNYSAYLIFKLSDSAMSLNYPLQEVSVTVGVHLSKLSVRLMEEQYSPSYRPIFCRPRFPWNRLHRGNQSVELEEDLPGEAADEPWHDRRRPNPREQLQDRSQRGHEMVGKPQIREDGWMEILLGEFYNEEGDDGEVVMSLMEVKGGYWKSGLIVQGIEIRAKKMGN